MMLSENQIPSSLIDGDVLALAYKGIIKALQDIMPANGVYRYVPITPRPSEKQWRAFTSKFPVVGLGWDSWHSDKGGAGIFRGPLVFTVAIITDHRNPDHLYLGNGTQPGAFGVTAAALSVLNALTVPGVGTAYVRSASSSELAQYLDDGQGSVLLTVQFDNVALDLDRILPQLDTFKQLSNTFKDSSSGEKS
ncbi:hypothetical protein [Gluconobacter oxydans]|uniref:hypothetical protein n=1 Tax=Gluconobacter oxydans TaxID=442 RepID=UPI003464BF44